MSQATPDEKVTIYGDIFAGEVSSSEEVGGSRPVSTGNNDTPQEQKTPTE